MDATMLAIVMKMAKGRVPPEEIEAAVNAYFETHEIPTEDAEARRQLLEKMNKMLLSCNGTKIQYADGTDVVFADLYESLMVKPDFVVLVYNNYAYHVNGVSTEQIVFSSNYPVNSYDQAHRITLLKNGTVTMVNTQDENVVNKTNVINETNKNSEVKYPTLKAVAGYVDPQTEALKEGLNTLAPEGGNLFNSADVIDGYYDASGNLVATTSYVSNATRIPLSGMAGKYVYINGQPSNKAVYFLMYRPNGEFRKSISNKYWNSPYLEDGYDGSLVIAVPKEWKDSIAVYISDTMPQTDPGYVYFGRKLSDSALPVDFNDKVGSIVSDYISEHPVGGINNGMQQVTIEYGANISPSTGWMTDGWTGSASAGFTHTAGNTNPLSVVIPTFSSGDLYRVTFTATNGDIQGRSDFYISLGGSATFETYKGGGASLDYDYAMVCGSGNTLSFTPRIDWTGTISGISVFKINSISVVSDVSITDNNGNPVFQARAGAYELHNVFIGKNSGEQNITGYGNAAFGDNALASVTGGFWNSAIGYLALEKCVQGSRNIAIGYTALKENESGDRNIAVGTFALRECRVGRNNIAVGADALQMLTTGKGNIGIGTLAGNFTNGDANIAIGQEALHNGTTANHNIAVGENAMQNGNGNSNIAIGSEALRDRGTNSNIAIGELAGKFGATGVNNLYLGRYAGMRNAGSNNVIIGFNADTKNNEDSNQVVIGTASHNTVIIAGKKLSFNADGTVTWESV